MYVYETITSRRTVSAHCRSGNLGWLVWELIFCPKMSTALSPPAGRNPDNVLGAILLISTFAQVTEKHPHTLSIEIHWLEVALTSPGGQNFGRSQCPLGSAARGLVQEKRGIVRLNGRPRPPRPRAQTPTNRERLLCGAVVVQPSERPTKRRTANPLCTLMSSCTQ